MSTPTLTLYTAPTPNGHKVSIALEALKELYPDSGLSYDFKKLDFSKLEQKEPWYLQINPNGRIPAVTHHRPDGSHFNVFETAAILLYLVQRWDPERKISFEIGSDEESEALQWIFFSHGGVGPMQGQANHFYRYAPEKIPYGINRYITETKRLYSVLEARLTQGEGRDYLVGSGKGKYSIADINVWPWVKGWAWSGIDNLDDFPNLAKWLDRIANSPGVQAGLNIPETRPAVSELTKEQQEEQARKASEWILRGNGVNQTK
ncbi:glutathione S-transferase [Cantharellus anzutake]|uniref:glutathione S-transferase n=1 Tax=Cantharellus anzutake TaxID=1750568 RepID=UPI001904825D|nr:glutathione S-transferase [Cantharellus anzutake]KAF8321031.1 glutathione S-transferase [Cantharellus anzutake]